MTSKEISKEIFYKPSTNGKAEKSIEEGAKLIDKHVEEQLKLYGVLVPKGTLPKKESECCGRCIDGLDTCIYDIEQD